MTGAARKLASYADVLEAPANMIAQLVDGELALQPRPASAHVRATMTLGQDLDRCPYFDLAWPLGTREVTGLRE